MEQLRNTVLLTSDLCVGLNIIYMSENSFWINLEKVWDSNDTEIVASFVDFYGKPWNLNIFQMKF